MDLKMTRVDFPVTSNHFARTGVFPSSGCTSTHVSGIPRGDPIGDHVVIESHGAKWQKPKPSQAPAHPGVAARARKMRLTLLGSMGQKLEA